MNLAITTVIADKIDLWRAIQDKYNYFLIHISITSMLHFILKE